MACEPMAVLKLVVFTSKVFVPTAVQSVPTVTAARALTPIEVLRAPVVTLSSAFAPYA